MPSKLMYSEYSAFHMHVTAHEPAGGMKGFDSKKRRCFVSCKSFPFEDPLERIFLFSGESFAWSRREVSEDCEKIGDGGINSN